MHKRSIENASEHHNGGMEQTFFFSLSPMTTGQVDGVLHGWTMGRSSFTPTHQRVSWPVCESLLTQVERLLKYQMTTSERGRACLNIQSDKRIRFRMGSQTIENGRQLIIVGERRESKKNRKFTQTQTKGTSASGATKY